MNLDEAFLDEKLAELERAANWSPRIISKLETLIRSSDPWAVFRVNPFAFARERGVNEDEAIDLFLLASKVGLFQMTWSLLCPGCGDAIQSLSTLQSVRSAFHCRLCTRDMETYLDAYVHVGFTISPKVRSIPGHSPTTLSIEDYYFRCRFSREMRLSEGGPLFTELLQQMTKASSWVEPRSKLTIEVEVEPGELAVYNALSAEAVVFAAAEGSQDNPVQQLRFGEGKLGAEPRPVFAGRLSFEIENVSDVRVPLMMLMKPQAAIDQYNDMVAAGVDAGGIFDPFLSGRRLLTCETFRRSFSGEIIKSADGISVRDISILFTDLKGSTELYDRIGDLKAFALVNQHFDRLARAITRHHGAVVKTIGDAVMASFETPRDAVHAARDMLREIDSFNEEVGAREIVLKIGVHRGASIAVTLNDRVDFFGQTVNIAARVQGLADADEIYVTEEVYQAPGVSELLGELHVTPRKASLKGVQRAMDVYRVGTAPASIPVVITA